MRGRAMNYVKIGLLAVIVVISGVYVLVAFFDNSMLARLIHPGYSWCGKCKMPWSNVEEHSTYYIRDNFGERGCFPLCETCWNSLTIEQRLPYYRELWKRWGTGRVDWKLIENAVREGK